jgi:hypothetical protein
MSRPIPFTTKALGACFLASAALAAAAVPASAAPTVTTAAAARSSAAVATSLSYPPVPGGGVASASLPSEVVLTSTSTMVPISFKLKQPSNCGPGDAQLPRFSVVVSTSPQYPMGTDSFVAGANTAPNAGQLCGANGRTPQTGWSGTADFNMFPLTKGGDPQLPTAAATKLYWLIVLTTTPLSATNHSFVTSDAFPLSMQRWSAMGATVQRVGTQDTVSFAARQIDYNASVETHRTILEGDFAQMLTVQKFVGGNWVNVATTETPFSGNLTFKVTVPKGTLLRGVIPASQQFLTTTSNTVTG